MDSPTVSPAPRSRSRWSRVLPWVVCTCVLLPNLYVVIGGRESFPFTSAPMFGHYVGETTPLFMFEFRGVQRDGGTMVIDPGWSGRAEAQVVRSFFSKFYGSTEARSPFGEHPDDTPQKLAARLERFFAVFHAALARGDKVPELTAIELHLVRIDRDRHPLERQQLGVYQVESNTYTHTRTGS